MTPVRDTAYKTGKIIIQNEHFFNSSTDLIQTQFTCSMVKTPCETLSNGNGSPIRQNPYKNKNQTVKVNGIIHFGGTVVNEKNGNYQ